jgi:hypothetical protein
MSSSCPCIQHSFFQRDPWKDCPDCGGTGVVKGVAEGTQVPDPYKAASPSSRVAKAKRCLLLARKFGLSPEEEAAFCLMYLPEDMLDRLEKTVPTLGVGGLGSVDS